MSYHNVTIDPKIKERVPTLYLETLEISKIKVTRTPEHVNAEKKQSFNKWKGKTLENLEAHPNIKAYRNIHEQFRAYSSDVLPAVENLFVRGILKGRFPTINSVVDSCNLVSVRNLIPIGVFDSDKIEGDVTLRLAKEGDMFTPIGKSRPMRVKHGIPILEDSKRIISSIGVRDSDTTKITKKTEALMLFSWGNHEIPKIILQKALREAESILSQLTR